jgi:hypothetical protein
MECIILINMKKTLILLFLLIGLFARTQTNITSDGLEHKISGPDTLKADKYYYLIGQNSYDWNIGVNWSADSCSTTKIFLQCFSGNGWHNYTSDSLITPTPTTRSAGASRWAKGTKAGIGYYWDEKLCFSKLRIFVDVTSKDTITIKGIYYRFVKKY